MGIGKIRKIRNMWGGGYSDTAVNRCVRAVLSRIYRRKSFHPGFSMYEFLKSNQDYEYALLKADAPYVPKTFPYDIPVGRDADILCLKRDYQNILERTRRWSSQIPKKYKLVWIESEFGCRLRICGIGGVLIYQVDLAWRVSGIKEGFVEEALKHRKRKGDYYILDEVHEYVYRMHSFHENPGKVHHREYLIAHREECNEELACKYLGFSLTDLGIGT